MTTTRHTDVASNAAANAAVFNGPFGQLDQAITNLFPIDLQAPKYRAIGVWDPVAGTGDATAAIVQAISDCAVGQTIWAPWGIYNYSSFTIPKSISLIGSGWYAKRDNLTTFGTAAYGTAANFAGTIFRSTAANGASVACSTTETNLLNVGGLLLIGPGSGTATGITFATGIVQSRHDLGVMNFSLGAAYTFCSDNDIHLVIRGCATGMTEVTNCNQNTLRLDIEQCGAGLVDDATCVANVYVNPIFQGNTATALVLNGKTNLFVGGYWENAVGARGVDVFGNNNTFHNITLSHTTDSVRVNAAVSGTYFEKPTVIAAATPFVDNGTGTRVYGDLTNFTFSGAPAGGVLATYGEQVMATDTGTATRMSTAVNWRVANAANNAYNVDVADPGDVVVRRGVAFWGHAVVGAQPAAPVTLADVIAIIRSCGLSA